MKKMFSLLLICALLMISACAPKSSASSEAVSSKGSVPTQTKTVSVTSEKTAGFQDVSPTAYYAEAARYCLENGLVSGTAEGVFSPDMVLSRGMLVTILWRNEKQPIAESSGFTDLKQGAYYETAVSWAAGENIVSGYGNGKFGPDDPIERQQLAVILYRYAQYHGRDVTAKGAAPFADDSSISAYAKTAVSWAREKGVVAGKSGNRFDPQGKTTRAEAVTMVYRYLNMEGKLPDAPETPENPGDGNTPAPPVGGESGSILVAYFSCTNTTKGIAVEIQKALGEKAVLHEIIPADPYTEEDLAYYTDCRADREQNDPSARPQIANSVKGFENYDVIFLGYPIWHGQAPKIIYTFLESYDFNGKTIIPFCTSHSSGIGSSDTNLHALAAGADWESGRRFGSGEGNAAAQWASGFDFSPSSFPYDGTFPQHEPFGTGVGIHPGRVVWDYDPQSVSWTNGNEHWWEQSHFDEAVILRMVRESLTALTRETTAAKAWTKIIESHNGGAGYRQGQKIAIKCNMNGSDSSIYGTSDYSYTNPVLLKALLTSLVEDLGASPVDITAYDVSLTFPQSMINLCNQGSLSGVQFADRVTGRKSGTAIRWSASFGGQESFLPTCVTEAEYLINLANLKGHSYGITLCGKNHFGSFINSSSPYVPMGANLHQWLTSGRMDEYSPLTDFMANEQLGGKTILYLLDGLICARSEGSSMSPSNTKWEMAPFNGGYTASIFLSQDPVAIDSVGADFLSNEPTIGADLDDENYLHEAGKVKNAPSGTAYKNGAGKSAGNLGVHEHWNNSTQKQYSRNLGKDEGIELVKVGKAG